MKAVMFSIQPKWCEKIASGEKTVEVRKTRPKIETPFKCYIYCTLQGSKEFFAELQNQLGTYEALCKWNRENWGNKKGKVIGEFVCDEITPLFNVATTSWSLLAGNVHEYAKSLVRMACLTEEEMHSYAKGKYCFAMHISDLVIYDKPKELSEFYHYCGDDPKCDGCKYLYSESNESVGLYEECCSPVEGCKPLTRPPQSWCYVEVQR